MLLKTLLLFITLFLSACVNKHGISAKYYSDCEEYYDLQGFYHKECGKDDIITYEKIGEKTNQAIQYFSNEKEKPKGNVW